MVFPHKIGTAKEVTVKPALISLSHHSFFLDFFQAVDFANVDIVVRLLCKCAAVDKLARFVVAIAELEEFDLLPLRTEVFHAFMRAFGVDLFL